MAEGVGGWDLNALFLLAPLHRALFSEVLGLGLWMWFVSGLVSMMMMMTMMMAATDVRLLLLLLAVWQRCKMEVRRPC